MLTEKMNATFPLYHSIFFQPFPVFSLNVHITTELNGTIMITFSMHSVVSFCSPFTVSQMQKDIPGKENSFLDMPFALKSFLLLIVGNKAAFQYIAAYEPLTLAADVLFCACSHLHHIPHWIYYLRILGMLRHSACISRQILFKICKSISLNAAKRRFKDYRPFVLSTRYYSFIAKKMQ